MSEPTYRVELTHRPENGIGVEWHAAVYVASEGPDYPYTTFDAFRATREEAFEAAQSWCKAKATAPLAPSTVFLTEDGDIIDRHEAGVLRDANAEVQR